MNDTIGNNDDLIDLKEFTSTFALKIDSFISEEIERWRKIR